VTVKVATSLAPVVALRVARLISPAMARLENNHAATET